MTFINFEHFPYYDAILWFSVVVFLLDQWIDGRQRATYLIKEMPSYLKDYVSKEKFDEAQAYGYAKAQVSQLRHLLSFALSLLVLHYEVYRYVWVLAESYITRVPWLGIENARDHEIWTALMFMCIFQAMTVPVGIPLQLYSQFVVEQRFGFNKQTLGGWVKDFIKQQILAAVLGLPILAGLLALVLWAGPSFWLYGWGFAAAVMLFMLTIYPLVIAPLFNKFEHLPDGELRSGIAQLAKRIDFPLTDMYTMDASTRSAHSNAYFYGLWYNKRIVLFDTLMTQCTTDEIVAIVGHEMGHYKRNHMVKNLVIVQVYFAVFLFLFGQSMNNPAMFQAFAFPKGHQPAMIGLLIFSMLFEPVDHVISVLQRFLSRKFEYEADAFAVDLGLDIGTALQKIHTENLSSMIVDPVYSAARLTHPHLTERLRAINERNKNKRK